MKPKIIAAVFLAVFSSAGLFAQLNYIPVENPEKLPILCITKMGDIICKNQGMANRSQAHLEVLYRQGEEVKSLLVPIVWDRNGQFVHRQLPSTIFKIIIRSGRA